jgi:hypothetical protein
MGIFLEKADAVQEIFLREKYLFAVHASIIKVIIITGCKRFLSKRHYPILSLNLREVIKTSRRLAQVDKVISAAV